MSYFKEKFHDLQATIELCQAIGLKGMAQELLGDLKDLREDFCETQAAQELWRLHARWFVLWEKPRVAIFTRLLVELGTQGMGPKTKEQVEWVLRVEVYELAQAMRESIKTNRPLDHWRNQKDHIVRKAQERLGQISARKEMELDRLVAEALKAVVNRPVTFRSHTAN